MHLKIGDSRRKIHKRGKTGEQSWQKELLSRPFGIREVVYSRKNTKNRQMACQNHKIASVMQTVILQTGTLRLTMHM